MEHFLLWDPQRTKIDLYVERDQIRWWWRVFAILASWLIVAGFTTCPIAIDNDKDCYRGSKFGLGVLAITLLSIGYMISILLCFVCQSWLFLQDSIFIPCLSSCTLGLLVVLFNMAVRRGGASDALFVAALVIAIVSMIMYGAAAFFVWRKIIIVHHTDGRRRERTSREWNDDASLITTDEQQRRQLLSLLFKKDTDRPSSPAASQSTFRIDLPDVNSPRESSRPLVAPETARTSPMPSPAPWDTRYHSNWDTPAPMTGPYRDQSPSNRELRRKEIELGGIRSRQNGGDGFSVPRIQRVQTSGFP